jgi:hypothetical protein
MFLTPSAASQSWLQKSTREAEKSSILPSSLRDRGIAALKNSIRKIRIVEIVFQFHKLDISMK